MGLAHVLWSIFQQRKITMNIRDDFDTIGSKMKAKPNYSQRDITPSFQKTIQDRQRYPRPPKPISLKKT